MGVRRGDHRQVGGERAIFVAEERRDGLNGTKRKTGPTYYQIRQCVDDACRFRYPAADDDQRAQRCPRCGAETRAVAAISACGRNRIGCPPASAAAPPGRRAARQHPQPLQRRLHLSHGRRRGHRHLYLCGITPTPDNPKLAKTSLGAEQTVGWSYHANAVDLIIEKRADYLVWALEETTAAVSLSTRRRRPPMPPSYWSSATS